MNKILFCLFLGRDDLKFNPFLLPLGPVYCATALKQSDHNEVSSHLLITEDYYRDKTQFFDTFIAYLKEHSFDIICFSGLSVDFLKIKNTVAHVKAAIPDLCIIVGGGLITADPIFAMENIDADFAIVGEGELSLVRLVDCLKCKIDYTSISGLIYRDNNNKVRVNNPVNISSLDDIYAPDYSIFPEFEEVIMTSKIYPILLSRSCPFKCSFCFHTSGTKYRSRSLNNIISEIKSAMEKYRVTHLFFLDELFGNKLTPSMKLVSEIKTLGLSYNAQTRADEVTEDKIRLFKETGCTNLSIGIESTSDIILRSMRKGITWRQIKDALQLIEKYEISTTANIIIGDIAETKETATNSIEWYKQNKIKYNLNIGMIQTYPGSELFNYAIQYNIITKVDFLNKADFPNDFVVNLTKMSDEEFTRIKKEVNLLKFLDSEQKSYLFGLDGQ